LDWLFAKPAPEVVAAVNSLANTLAVASAVGSRCHVYHYPQKQKHNPKHSLQLFKPVCMRTLTFHYSRMTKRGLLYPGIPTNKGGKHQKWIFLSIAKLIFTHLRIRLGTEQTV
jgi:hypothetical protein